MEGLSRVVSVLTAWAVVLSAQGGAPDAIYISPAGHNFRADGMPLHTAAEVTASLETAKTMGIKRVYWRGFQEDYLMRHAVVQAANYQLANYWEWMRDTADKRGIHRAALGVEGLEMWGVFGLFDLGSSPREDAYCGAAAGYGPAIYADTLRSKYREEIPMDGEGIREECGPIRFRKPEVRKELIDRLVAGLDEGYAGLLLYSYMENLSLWFPDEFGAPLPTAEVETFLRELKSAMKGRKLALQVDARAAFRNVPSPWLGLTPDTNTVGAIALPWEDWVREGLLDEVVFSIAPGAGEEAVKLCSEMSVKYPKTGFRLLARTTMPPESECPLTLDARSSAFVAAFRKEAVKVDALKAWALAGQGDVLPREGSAAITAALKGLKQTPEHEAYLLETVKRQAEFPVREQAADTLGAWDAADLMSKLADDPDAGVRRVAFNAATKMSTLVAARPLLEKATRDESAYNRWVGFRGMGRYPLDGAVIFRGLADEDATVRCVAAWLVRPGQKVSPELIQALKERFVALHDGKTWMWEYRTAGDALMNCGAEGRAFLESCLTQAKEKPALADSAWRCLFVPQNGGSLVLVTKEEAGKAYAAYPPAARGRVVSHVLPRALEIFIKN